MNIKVKQEVKLHLNNMKIQKPRLVLDRDQNLIGKNKKVFLVSNIPIQKQVRYLTKLRYNHTNKDK